jgi:hypothetical protein
VYPPSVGDIFLGVISQDALSISIRDGDDGVCFGIYLIFTEANSSNLRIDKSIDERSKYK